MHACTLGHACNQQTGQEACVASAQMVLVQQVMQAFMLVPFTMALSEGGLPPCCYLAYVWCMETICQYLGACGSNVSPCSHCDIELPPRRVVEVGRLAHAYTCKPTCNQVHIGAKPTK